MSQTLKSEIPDRLTAAEELRELVNEKITWSSTWAEGFLFSFQREAKAILGTVAFWMLPRKLLENGRAFRLIRL